MTKIKYIIILYLKKDKNYIEQLLVFIQYFKKHTFLQYLPKFDIQKFNVITSNKFSLYKLYFQEEKEFWKRDLSKLQFL